MNGSNAAKVVSQDSYYGSENHAATLMRIANFPDDVLSLLQLETLVAINAIQRYGCTAVVELGCYDGRSIELSRSLDLRYVGVDINPQAIRSLTRRIADEHLEGRAEAVLADALDLDQWADRVREQRPLIHLPFNFLGSFQSPLVLLNRLCRMPNAFLLISVFNTSRYTTDVRRRYYSACGVRDLKVTCGGLDAAIFTGERNFFSRAFAPEMLESLFEECGADTLLLSTNRLGICVVAKPLEAGEILR